LLHPTGPRRRRCTNSISEKRKFEEVKTGVSSVTITANGEKILYRQGLVWYLDLYYHSRPNPGEGVVKTSEMETYVDPRVEWRQMFNEIWRGERDFLY
jgi:tricorn protease